MANKTSREEGREEEGTDFSFDPGSQIELEPEETCCVTGEPITSGFCRFPDYVSGTLMVMSKKAMIEHLRTSTTIQVFKEVLVKRHGKAILEEDYYSNF